MLNTFWFYLLSSCINVFSTFFRVANFNPINTIRCSSNKIFYWSRRTASCNLGNMTNSAPFPSFRNLKRYLKRYLVIYTNHLAVGKLLIIGIRESILP